MSTSRPSSAKIIQHSEGLGAPSPDTVRQRAHELAIINGRSQFNDEDWREAKRELQGGHAESDEDGEMGMAAMISGHDMVAGSLGHHTENMHPEASDSVGEELIAEGMDEAVHEQMLLSRADEEREEVD